MFGNKFKTTIDNMHFEYLEALYNQQESYLKNNTHNLIFDQYKQMSNKEIFKTNYVLHKINYNKPQKVEDRIFLDKLIFHTNFLPNKENLIEEIKYNEKLHFCKINYKYHNNNKKHKAEKERSIIIVRMGIWILSPYIFIKRDESLNKFKIFDEEWHHLLIQYEDSLDGNTTFSFCKSLSFLNLISRFLSQLTKTINTDHQKIKENNYNLFQNLRIVDYDFYLKGNPLCNSNDIYNKNELYYLKGLISTTDKEDIQLLF